MVKTIERSDVASGMWKFKDTTSIVELYELAEEWKAGPDGDKYLDLHVRRCSKNQWGIGFQYARKDDTEKSQNAFFHKMTDQLKRRFGNDFVGWDVSSFTFIIT